MPNKCRVCGDRMVISLQKLLYQSIEISNVPVACCTSCQYSNVMDGNVKADLKQLLYHIAKKPEKKNYQFEEYCSEVLLELSSNDWAGRSFYQ